MRIRRNPGAYNLKSGRKNMSPTVSNVRGWFQKIFWIYKATPPTNLVIALRVSLVSVRGV